jgi:hypothetical protein
VSTGELQISRKHFLYRQIDEQKGNQDNPDVPESNLPGTAYPKPTPHFH